MLSRFNRLAEMAVSSTAITAFVRHPAIFSTVKA
jgi:hypothetical protein